MRNYLGLLNLGYRSAHSSQAGIAKNLTQALAPRNLFPKIPSAKQSRETSMALKDMAALYGRVCVIVAAFALVAGIIASPIVQKVFFPQSDSYARNSFGPLLDPIKTETTASVGKQG